MAYRCYYIDLKILKQQKLQIGEHLETLKKLDEENILIISLQDNSEELCIKEIEESEAYQEEANLIIFTIEETLSKMEERVERASARASPVGENLENMQEKLEGNFLNWNRKKSGESQTNGPNSGTHSKVVFTKTKSLKS